jgi:hypothetical protein
MATDKKISELPVISAVTATDVSVLVHNGADYQFDFTTLLQFINSGINPGASISFGTTLPQNTTGKNGDIFINTTAGSFAQKQSGAWSVKYTLPVNNGTDGTVLYGSGIPGTGIGNNNDTYINIDTGIFYHKTEGTWAQVFSMQTGPQGPKGDKGETGATGTNGKTILSGTSTPSNNTGANGDIYLNTNTYQLFGPKTNGVWGSGTSIIGLTGEQGDAGPAGTAGAGVATGGTTGQVLSKVSDADFDTEWVDQTGGGGSSNAVEITFGSILAFDNDKYMSTNQTGTISFTLAGSGNILGKTISAKVVGDSVHVITFDTTFKILSGVIDNTKTNYLYFNYVAADEVRVTISFEGGTSGGSGNGNLVGGDLANGKMLLGDGTSKAKAVTPSGDVRIDEYGVVKIANSLSNNSVAINQVVFRDFLGDLKGSDACRFGEDTGFNVSTDQSSSNEHIVANLFKSKVRTTFNISSGTQVGWQFEVDAKGASIAQELTGFLVRNKLDAIGADSGINQITRNFFRVTSINPADDVETDKMRYYIDNNGREQFKLGNGFNFYVSNGVKTMNVSDDLQIIGGTGNDKMLYLGYTGNRSLNKFRVGSISDGYTEMLRLDAEVSNTKAAIGIKQGSYSEYYQLNGKIDAGSITPIKLYEFLTSRGSASGFFVIEVTAGAWTNNGASSTIDDTAYWILSTGASADQYGAGDLAFTNGVATSVIKVEKSSGAADWNVYFALDQAGKHIQLFADSTSANTKSIAFTANIKVTWITYQ